MVVSCGVPSLLPGPCASPAPSTSSLDPLTLHCQLSCSTQSTAIFHPWWTLPWNAPMLSLLFLQHLSHYKAIVHQPCSTCPAPSIMTNAHCTPSPLPALPGHVLLSALFPITPTSLSHINPVPNASCTAFWPSDVLVACTCI